MTAKAVRCGKAGTTLADGGGRPQEAEGRGYAGMGALLSPEDPAEASVLREGLQDPPFTRVIQNALVRGTPALLRNVVVAHSSNCCGEGPQQAVAHGDDGAQDTGSQRPADKRSPSREMSRVLNSDQEGQVGQMCGT